MLSGHLSRFLCCISSEEHFAYEPISLTCGGYACPFCIEDSLKLKLKCRKCSNVHDLSNDTINESVDLKNFLKNDTLNEAYSSTLSQFDQISALFKGSFYFNSLKNLTCLDFFSTQLIFSNAFFFQKITYDLY